MATPERGNDVKPKRLLGGLSYTAYVILVAFSFYAVYPLLICLLPVGIIGVLLLFTLGYPLGLSPKWVLEVLKKFLKSLL